MDDAHTKSWEMTSEISELMETSGTLLRMPVRGDLGIITNHNESWQDLGEDARRAFGGLATAAMDYILSGGREEEFTAWKYATETAYEFAELATMNVANKMGGVAALLGLGMLWGPSAAQRDAMVRESMQPKEPYKGILCDDGTVVSVGTGPVTDEHLAQVDAHSHDLKRALADPVASKFLGDLYQGVFGKQEPPIMETYSPTDSGSEEEE